MRAVGYISGSRPVVITADLSVNTLTQAFTSDLILLVNISQSNAPTVGSLNVSLYADTFGIAGSLAARVGLSSTLLTNWVSTTALKVKVSAGVVSNLGIAVTSEKLVSTSALTFTYDVLKLLSLQAGGTDSALWAQELDSARLYTGGNDLTIVGTGFGTADLTPSVQVGNRTCLDVQWIADTSLVCKTAAASWSTQPCADGSCVSNQAVTVELLQQVSNEPCVEDLGWKDRINNSCSDYTVNAKAMSNKYDCGWNRTITASTGIVTDGDGNYSNNIVCQWYIFPSEAISLMGIVFDEFATEATYDRVRIYSCQDSSCSSNNLEGELFGTWSNKSFSCTSCVGLHVIFETDFSIVSSGFSARFYTSNSPSWAVDLPYSFWQVWCGTNYANQYPSTDGRTAREMCCSCRGENYVYECPSGYQQVGYYQDAPDSVCEDINNCGIDHNCSLYQYYDIVSEQYTSLGGECVNTDGGFTCVCTGSTCDSVAVKPSQTLDQALLDSVQSNAKIQLLRGNYSSPCNLTLSKSLTLAGASDGSTYIECSSATVFIRVTSSTLIIKDVSIMGSSDTVGCVNQQDSSAVYTPEGSTNILLCNSSLVSM
eukprot:762603-Hanusia_phi.AAC.1